MALTRQNDILNIKLDQLTTSQKARKANPPKIRNVWIKNGERNTCHDAHIALKTRDNSLWYIDIGCSRICLVIELYLKLLKSINVEQLHLEMGEKPI